MTYSPVPGMPPGTGIPSVPGTPSDPTALSVNLNLNIRSVQVGRVQTFDEANHSEQSQAEKPWDSGIIKSRVQGPVTLRRTNLAGDEQADLVHHGGVDKAVLVYPWEHYAFWGTEFREIQWEDGCFGENLTTSGGVEADVCVGDIFETGDCRLQISQPRQPCWKLSRRWGLPKLAVRVQQTRRTGWYLRVLAEGTLMADQPMRLVERSYPRFTIAYANEVMYAKPNKPKPTGTSAPMGSLQDRTQQSHELAKCEALSESWRKTLLSR